MVFVLGFTATSSGLVPTLMVAVTRFVLPLITDTVLPESWPLDPVGPGVHGDTLRVKTAADHLGHRVRRPADRRHRGVLLIGGVDGVGLRVHRDQQRETPHRYFGHHLPGPRANHRHLPDLVAVRHVDGPGPRVDGDPERGGPAGIVAVTLPTRPLIRDTVSLCTLAT